MIKKILLGLGVILGLILSIGFVAPKDFVIERAIVINKPKALVFAEIKQLKKHNDWSPWAKLDRNMKVEFRGTDGTVGFVSAWSGNSEVGVGEQEIKAIVEGQKIELALRFKEPMEDSSQVFLTTESLDANQTKVKWTMKGVGKFPFNIVCFFMGMNSKMEKDFDDGLSSLKALLEK